MVRDRSHKSYGTTALDTTTRPLSASTTKPNPIFRARGKPSILSGRVQDTRTKLRIASAAAGCPAVSNRANSALQRFGGAAGTGFASSVKSQRPVTSFRTASLMFSLQCRSIWMMLVLRVWRSRTCLYVTTTLARSGILDMTSMKASKFGVFF